MKLSQSQILQDDLEIFYDMQPINENLVMLSPGDSFQGLDDCLKIYLSGSLDMSGNGVPWQQKFINGLSKMTAPGPKEPGCPDYSTFKFAVVNPLGPSNGEPILDNPEYVQKMQWSLQCQGEADVIFCNFLKKSKLPSAINDFLVWSQSGKVVVRVPGESVFFPTVKILSEAFHIPVVGDSSSIIKVMEAIFQGIPKFQELTQYGL